MSREILLLVYKLARPKIVLVEDIFGSQFNSILHADTEYNTIMETVASNNSCTVARG